MKTKLTIALSVAAGLGIAAEPSDYIPLEIPEGATQIENSKILIPLAHKAKSALLLYNRGRGDELFVVLQPDRARELAGKGYKEVEGLQTILVRWAFVEPVEEKDIDMVSSQAPTVYLKDGVLFVSCSGIDIGEVGRTVEGALIIQVPNAPKEVVFKLSKIGW